MKLQLKNFRLKTPEPEEGPEKEEEFQTILKLSKKFETRGVLRICGRKAGQPLSIATLLVDFSAWQRLSWPKIDPLRRFIVYHFKKNPAVVISKGGLVCPCTLIFVDSRARQTWQCLP